MIRAGVPDVAQLPGILGEKEAEEGEEEASDFEPEDAACVSEGSPDGLAEFFCAAGDSAAAVGALLNIDGSLLPHSGSLLLHGMSGLRGAVADHAGGDADTDAEFAA